MKLIDTKPENFNANYIYFNEPIQNTIINESRFIRILYSTPNIIFNGINILLKIRFAVIFEFDPKIYKFRIHRQQKKPKIHIDYYSVTISSQIL